MAGSSKQGNAETSREPGLLADSPLVTPDQDRLGRAPFSRMLAESIVNLDIDDGFVFALYGPWGSGKSTILNFVEYYLDQSAKEPKPIVVRFNPWWFSGQDQLLLQFFAQLRKTLQQPDLPGQLRQAGEAMQTLAWALTPLKWLPKVRELAKEAQALLGEAAGALDAAGRQMEQDVWTLHDDIAKALRGQDRRIVIIIDDIDRLPAVEIQQMFRLIKAIADFPRTIYVLAFDRSVVTKALEDFQGGSGAAYLQKVVQAPFDLPPADPEALLELAVEQLQMILSGTEAGLWDSDRWSRIYWEGIAPLMRTPRDVKRYINALRPGYAVVKGEVNAVGFAAIEALRVFAPDVYYAVQVSGELLAETKDLWDASRSSARETETDIYDRYLEMAPKDGRAAVRALLCHLFPRYAVAAGQPLGGIDLDGKWRKESRICDPDVFPVYFRLSVPEGAMSNAEMRTLLSLATHPAKLSQEMHRLAGTCPPNRSTTRLRAFLERLLISVDDIPATDLGGVLQALLDAGDVILNTPDVKGFADDTNHTRAFSVVAQLIRRLPSQQDRYQVLRRALRAAGSVPMCAHLVGRLGQEHGKFVDRPPEVPEARRTVSSTHLAELEQIMVAKIGEAAQAGTLVNVPDLPYLLFHWRTWASTESVEQYVTQLLTSDEGLADFAAGFLEPLSAFTSRDYAKPNEWKTSIQSLERYADVGAIVQRAQRILYEQPAWLTDRRRTALQVLVRTAQGPQGGSTEDSDDRPGDA